MKSAIVVSSSGAAAAIGTSPRSTSRVAGRKRAPPSTMSTGTSRYWSRVTIPKLPPPPRSAQNRSGFDVSLAVRTSPLAVTISTETRWSIVRPCPRARKPTPPLSVIPAIPTDAVSPSGVARPCAAAARV